MRNASAALKREPIVRIARRDGIAWPKAWLARVLCVFAALIIDGLIIYSITNLNPINVYITMFDGAFGTTRRVWITVRDAMVLLIIAVGLAPAFKMRFWNIGAEGQILVGGIAAAATMIYLSALPTPVLFIVMFLLSMLAGAVWGVIPALFKAKFETNETLFTLMMNYVAIQLTSFCVAKWENPFGSNTVGVINQSTKIGWLPTILTPWFGKSNFSINVLIVMSVAIAMFYYLKYSKQGYEIAVVGESENTARYAGINVGRVIVRTMLISGAICGLAGLISVSGVNHTISTSISGGRGFTAIIVAWLAKFNTLAMTLISFLLIFLERGASQIASVYNLNEYASEMLIGVILFFILGSEFFINYKLIFRARKEG